MLKITVIEMRGQRRLVLEGTLVTPWIAEVESAWRGIRQHVGDEKLIVDLTNVTFISRDGENILLELMRDGARFSSRDVLTKHVLQRVARRCRCEAPEDCATHSSG
jgi:hypothetical protein